MKAISLWQPWATLLVHGIKRHETRSWAAPHWGPVIIHAAKRWTQQQRKFCQHPKVAEAIRRAGYMNAELLPRGGLVGVVEVVNCVRDTAPPSELEGLLGEFGPGRFVWICDKHRAFPRCVPWRGRQGMFEVDTTEVRL